MEGWMRHMNDRRTKDWGRELPFSRGHQAEAQWSFAGQFIAGIPSYKDQLSGPENSLGL